MNRLFLLTLSIATLMAACKSTGLSVSVPTNASNKQAKQVLAKTIEAHGGQRYATAHYSFVFRKKTYTFKNNQKDFHYTASQTTDQQKIVDHLTNNDFSRTVDGAIVPLSEKQRNSYRGSLNSVIYFATLPYKLKDPAVNVSHEGTTSIKGKKYDVLKITFDEKGGGKDHDDVFHYWINQDTYFIDYLAYNYQVNNGGVRFRSAYNPRKVDGILFQDYINYKAPVGTPLAELPKLYEQDALKKLSVIETENVTHLK